MKKSTLTALTVGTIALGVITIGSAVSAYQGDYSKTGPEHTAEREAVMTQAFENADYNSWKANMVGKGRVTEVINEGNFARFAEAHRLGEAGDMAGADAIRAELGLRNSNGEALGLGRGEGRGQGQRLKDGSGTGRANSGSTRGQGRGLMDGSANNADCILNQ